MILADHHAIARLHKLQQPDCNSRRCQQGNDYSAGNWLAHDAKLLDFLAMLEALRAGYFGFILNASFD
jgi:hypothetical protein